LSLPAAAPLGAETGYELWLRYAPLRDAGRRAAGLRAASAIVVQGRSPAARAIADELRRGLRGLLGAEPAAGGSVRRDGAIVVGTPSDSPLVAALGWTDALRPLGGEGYLIRSTRVAGHAATVIASESEAGALHGTFHFLRLLQTDQPVASLEIAQRPR